MRIRSIKPEFWRSDDITALSRELRLLFIGLWQYVDDNGVGVDDYRQIAADLFALEDDQTEVRQFVRDGLATLARGLLIVRYEVAGRSYFFIQSWDRHQRVDRPGKPRFPRPCSEDMPSTSNDVADRDPHANASRPSPESHATGAGEQGSRGAGAKKGRAPQAARPKQHPKFDEFWAAYPLKRDKQDAVRKFEQVVESGVDPDKLIAAAKRYRDDPHRKPEFTKHAATWLHKGAYEDEPIPLLRMVSGQTVPADYTGPVMER